MTETQELTGIVETVTMTTGIVEIAMIHREENQVVEVMMIHHLLPILDILPTLTLAGRAMMTIDVMMKDVPQDVDDINTL